MKKVVIASILMVASTITAASVIQVEAANTEVKQSVTSTIKGLFDKAKEKKTEIEIKTNKKEIKTNKKEIKTNRKEFKDNFENITKYVRQNLTETQRKEVKSIIESRIKAIETLNKKTRTQLSGGIQLNTGDFTTKVTEIYNGFKTSMLPYIDSAKTESFKTFITERIKLISTNRGLKSENKEIKKEIIEKKVEKKIEKKSEKELKAIAEETKPLKELIKKIDELLKKTKTQAIKDALSSAKKALQAQVPTTGTTAK